MTQENRSVFLFLFALTFLCISASAEFTKSSILSNDISSVSGRGDTLWVATSHGVNFTTNLSSDTVVWYGDNSLIPLGLYYENGKAFIVIPGNDNYNTSFHIYDHQSSIGRTEYLHFNMNSFNNEGDDVNTNFYFNVFDVSWIDSAYWMSCLDGGVAKYESELNVNVFIPGDTISRKPETLNTSILGAIPDNKKRVSSISSANNNKLWVATFGNLWLFDYDSIDWDSLGFPGNISGDIMNVYSNSKDSNKVTVLIELTGTNDSILGNELYEFNLTNTSWKKIDSKYFTSVDVGLDGDIFAASFSEKDKIYRYSTNDSIFSIAVDGTEFKDRLNEAEGAPLNFEIQDITFSSVDDLDVLAIATTKGLFYSLDEYTDEGSKSAFKFTKRSVPVKSGLEQTYSYPSIINGNAELGKDKAYFAYNLSKDSKVSIDIYDYNMDHVVRIIDDAPRNAGDKNPSGRSTVESQDYWDGTAQNDGGIAVPPGVYYYRIKSDEGEKAFGKVIVAKN